MNLKEIEKLLQLILGTDIEELEITRGPASLKIRRRLHSVSQASLAEEYVVERRQPAEEPAIREGFPKKGKDVFVVFSPLVGTFYRAPAPDARSFVEEGEVVSQGQVLCIVEAMKLMNEIHAEKAGKITKVYVENGHPVEYGEPLFDIEPA